MDELHVAAPAAVSAAVPGTGIHDKHLHAGHQHAHSLSRGTAVRRFALHYLEMVVAMVVGMVALAPVWAFAGDALGWTATLERADVGSIVMATNMTVVMCGWMRFRGHSRRPTVEMGAAMYLPFIVLLVPLWAGLISAHTLMHWGHVLMLFAMLGAMLLRPAEYVHHKH